MRGQPRDVGDDVEPDRSRAQGFEDAARSDRVADALVDPVAFRDLVVRPHMPQACYLDRADDVIAAFEHLGAIGRRPDRPPFAGKLDETLRDPARQVESGGVDVDQRKDAFVEPVDSEDVGHELAREDRAASSDHRHLRHDGLLSVQISARSSRFRKRNGQAPGRSPSEAGPAGSLPSL